MGLTMEFGLRLDLLAARDRAHAAERRQKELEAEIAVLRDEIARLRKLVKLSQEVVPTQADLDRWERERLQWILDEGGFGGA